MLDCRTIECPKHNGRFDVRSGEPVRRPVKLPLATYDVAVVDGRVVSDLVARTHQVSSPILVPTDTR
jgi:nitrite reductase/ring-hydroxylating ferredoxin subunit